MSGYAYLASPYSHLDIGVRRDRYRHAVRCIAWLAGEGVGVYSPIAHWHEAAQRAALPYDGGFWSGQNDPMLAASSGLIVLCLPGWEESVGVAEEIRQAGELGLPVRHLAVREDAFAWVTP